MKAIKAIVAAAALVTITGCVAVPVAPPPPAYYGAPPGYYYAPGPYYYGPSVNFGIYGGWHRRWH